MARTDAGGGPRLRAATMLSSTTAATPQSEEKKEIMSKARVPVGVPGAEFIGPMHVLEVGNGQVGRGAQRAADPIQAGRPSRVSRSRSGRWGKVRGLESVPAAVQAGHRRGGSYEVDWHARIADHIGRVLVNQP
jgi:hypothetical protein